MKQVTGYHVLPSVHYNVEGARGDATVDVGHGWVGGEGRSDGVKWRGSRVLSYKFDPQFTGDGDSTSLTEQNPGSLT